MVPTLVLIIDDQPNVLLLLRVLCERTLPNVEDITTTSADTALQLFQQRRCDVVLSDVHMPGQDGWYVLREVKRQWPTVPVVLMSGCVIEKDALNAGADAFLAKPFGVEEIQSIVMPLTGQIVAGTGPMHP
jgi:two-component system capsular synthesis sensor histidine kinase RcsC